MQLRHLRYFVKIVEAGSFSGAAALLYVAQSALSIQLQELEQELGVKVLVRSNRGVRPTEEGERLYKEATAFLRRLDRLPEVARSGSARVTGSVQLGIPAVLTHALAGPFMTACRAALPEVTLSFASTDSIALRSRLVENTLDLAVAFEEEPLPGLSRVEMFRQQMYVLHTNEAFRDATSLTYTELAKWPLISPGKVWLRSMEKRFAAERVVPTIVAETQEFSSHLAAVSAGIGAIILPIGDPSSIPGAAGIIATPINDFHLTASVVWSANAQLSRASEAVRELLVSFLRERLEKEGLVGATPVASG